MIGLYSRCLKNGKGIFSYFLIWFKIDPIDDGGMTIMKKTMIKRTLRMGCVVALLCLLGLISAFAGGPPLKENACGVCHQDYSKIMPPKHPDVGKVTACMTCHKTDPAKTDSTLL